MTPKRFHCHINGLLICHHRLSTELIQCPRRYRFLRRSGLDALYNAEYDESVYLAQSIIPASGQYVFHKQILPRLTTTHHFQKRSDE
jgi:hypothetical protein